MSGDRVAGIMMAACAALLLSAAPAAAQWKPAEGQAAVTLPQPSKPKGLADATLSCDLQRWTLTVAMAPLAVPPADPVSVSLKIDRDDFRRAGTIRAGALVVPVERGFLEIMKSGGALTISAGEKSTRLTAAYSLRGARDAIGKIEPLCSSRDLSGLEELVLSEFSPVLAMATELRKDEIKTFRRATGRAPRLAAETFLFDGERRILFAELCGGGDYYGRSGCSLAGFAQTGAETEWRIAYEGEGARLHVDRARATSGWLDIVARPKQGGEDVTWRWDGGRYRAAPATD